MYDYKETSMAEEENDGKNNGPPNDRIAETYRKED
jgi:hypothetical protein